MKLLAIFVVLTSQFLISNGRPTLRNEIQQVLELVDFQKIGKIFREYAANDPSVKELSEYIQSSTEYKTAWNIFISSSEVEDILEWITRKHFINLHLEIRKFADKAAEVKPSRRRRMISTFFREIVDQINVADIKKVINKLTNDGNDFAHLMLIFKVSQPALEQLFEVNQIRLAKNHLQEFGVDMQQVKKIVYNLLGWE